MALVTPTNGKPSNPYNRMWAWGLFASVVLPLTVAAGPVALSVGTLAGMAIGYYTGERKRQKELETGFKTVRKPSLINGGMAKGWIWGSIVGTALGLGVAAAILLASGGTAAVAAGFSYSFGAGTVAPAALGLAAVAASVTGIVTNLTMTVKGAFRRRNEMREDYQEAEAYQQSLARAQARQQTVAAEPSMAQDYSQSLAHPAHQRGDRKWVEDVAAKPGPAQGHTIA